MRTTAVVLDRGVSALNSFRRTRIHGAGSPPTTLKYFDRDTQVGIRPGWLTSPSTRIAHLFCLAKLGEG